MTVSTNRLPAKDLAQRLRARRDEIEQTLLTRVHAVSDPAEIGDPEYVVGLREAVGAALNYALVTLEGGEEARPLPPQLSAQAGMAARNGVSLDTVLRRYFAGYTLLCDCLMREVGVGGVRRGATDLRQILRDQGTLFDRLVVAVTETYIAEAERRHATTAHRRVERVRRLLGGELVDVSELDYPLEGWHLGVVGSGTPEAIRELATRLECRLLVVHPGGGIAWAWLGSRRELCSQRLIETTRSLSPGTALALGEPARGLEGWRSTHRQAVAALPVAQRSGKGLVRYADVALLAASLRDDVLSRSLHDFYLAPLAGGRDGGGTLRETLRAYFDAGSSVSSAASALGVNRNTVASRLRTVEDALGRSLLSCGGELDVALRLEELQGAAEAVSR